MPEPTTTTTLQSVAPAQLSALLFRCREQLSMWNDVVYERAGVRDADVDRVIRDIDKIRADQGWSPNGFGGETDRPGIIVHAGIEHPDSVTHFVCSSGTEDQGWPVSHSMRTVTVRDVSVLRCRYCEKTEAQLREEIGL